MEMTLKRKLTEGTHCESYQVITLSEEEMRQVYEEYRMKVHFKDWVRDLLEENGYPPQTEDLLDQMVESYVNLMENGFGEDLGELEHRAFEYMMETYYPEIEREDD